MDTQRIPLNLGNSTDRSFEEYERSAPTTSAEATGAAFDLATPDTAVMLAARGWATREFERTGAKPLSPEEANERYPRMKTPFREPVNPYVAQMLSDREEETARLADKIARGPSDTWTKTKQFGAGLLAHLMDPVEFGAGHLVGVAVGGMAVRGAFGTRAALATDLVAQGARVSGATRLAVNVGEGAIGAGIENAAQELGQAAVEAKEGFDSGRTGGDIAFDWATGTVAAGALQTGIKEASFRLGGMKRMLKSTSPEADLAMLRNAVQAIYTDIRPDPQPMLKALAHETSVLPQDFGHPEYKFEPVSAQDVGTRKFYAATVDANPDLKLGTKADLGDDFGFGRHLSDNPGVANAASARSMADSAGLVHEVEITGELRPLPIGVTATNDPDLASGLTQILSEVMDDAKTVVRDEPIKNVLGYIRNAVDEEIIPESAISEVEALIKSRGYNALLDDGSTRLGQTHEPHNHITILDDELINGRQAMQPDSKVVRAPEQMDLEAMSQRQSDPSSKFHVDMDQYARDVQGVEEFRLSAREDLNKFSQTLDEALLEVEDLQRQGFYSEADVEAFKMQLKESRLMAEDEQTFLKAFKACAGA